MIGVSGPAMEKGVASRRYAWRLVWVVGVFLPLLAALFFFAPSPHASAASHNLARRLTSSPSQGPVGAVIVVTGSGMPSPDGTQIDLGYSTDFSNCNAATDSQPGIVQNHAFSGWFRWPTGTGTGNFEVCASVHGSNSPFFAGMYQVLSATPPQISIAPTIPSAGKQATITGANFLPAGTSVKLVWPAANGLPSTLLATVTSDNNGAFTQAITVPAHAITGTYSVEALAGSGQPPTMSAATTFHVNGIVITAVPTPTPTASPTASATAAATSPATSNVSGTRPTTNVNGNTVGGGTNLLLPVALVGLVLIVAALMAGVYVVRKQRALALAAAAAPPWPAASNMAGDGLAPAQYQAASQLPFGIGRSTKPQRAVSPSTPREPIPFDPGLAEAMRQAQVSLFVTPRPPVGEEVHS
jgi:hypothetical protein